MKFTHRILLIPILATLALVLTLGAVWYASDQGVRLVDRVEREFGVFITVSHDLETVLIQIPPILQTAMNAEDPDIIAEADSLQARYTGLLDSIRGRPQVEDADLDRAQQRFDKYYSLARRATQAMIASGLDVPESVFSDLMLMNEMHDDLVTDLRIGAESIRADLDQELQQARDMSRRMRRLILITSLTALVVLFVISLATVRSVLRPVRSIRDATEGIAHGDLHQRLEFRSDDDLGRLADAFRRMQHHLIMDIDRREKAEAALRSSEERLALAFDAANDGLWDLDTTARRFYFSPRFVQMLGFAEDEIPRSLDKVRDMFHPDDVRQADKAFEAHLSHGFPFDIELRIKQNTGIYCWYHMRGKIVERDQDSLPTRVVGTLVDICTRKTAEEMLLERTHELEEALDNLSSAQTQLVEQAKLASLGQIVAGLTHELNTPVGTVAASADLAERARAKVEKILAEAEDIQQLRSDPSLARAMAGLRSSAANVQRASSRINDQLQDLKSFSRLDQADIQRTDLIAGLESTLSVLAGELGDRITVKRDYGELPLVLCHPGEINQVFLNLLTNAIRAIADEGVINISSRAADQQVTITIADTGVGIEADRLATLFEVGFTASDKRVKVGWGLATVQQTVKRHGGEVQVTSEVGQGSAFSVTLPVAGIPS